MTFQMRWLVLPLILLQLLWLPTVAGATEMIRVTGRAAIEPRGQDAAERLALEDALYMAAMAGGAELNGFSMVENGILVGETVLLRPVRVLPAYAGQQFVSRVSQYQYQKKYHHIFMMMDM